MIDADISPLARAGTASKRWVERHKEWLAVAAIAAALLLTRSWEGDLHGDPVRYAAVARNIAATGDWLTLYDGPEAVYANKPPLMFWLVAANFRLFGVSTYTAKLWSCLFGVGACLLTYLVGRRLFGGTAGVLAGCMLAMSAGFVLPTVDLRLDSAVTFFAVLAVYAVLRAEADDRPQWLLLAGLAGGVGLMTKLSAGLHVAALVLLLLGVRRPRMLASRYSIGAVALAVAIAAPWHVFLIARDGDSFVDVYFAEQVGERLVMGSHFVANVWANASVLLLRSLPWSLFGAYALARWRRLDAADRSGMRLALLWIAEVVLLMAVPPKRFDRYVLPAYPAVALLSGYGLNLLLSARLRRAVPAVVTGIALTVIFVLATVPVQVHTYRCRGFAIARDLLDQAAPGDDVVTYDPRAATKGVSWGLRSKVSYYLQRRLVPYAELEPLLASSETFVIARDGDQDTLTAAGFRVMLPLDDHYALLHRSRTKAAEAAVVP